MKKRIPPITFNPSTEIPKKSKITFPERAKSVRVINETRLALIATLLLSATEKESVREIKIGTTASGLIIVNSSVTYSRTFSNISIPKFGIVKYINLKLNSN